MKAFLQKLGWYLTFLFLGGLLTLYLVAKYIGFDSTKVDIKINSIKQKRVKGNPSTTVPITVDVPETGRKSRKERKKEKG